MKNSQTKSLLLTAAMTGLLSVGMPAFASAHASTTQTTTNLSSASGKASVRTLLSQDNQQGDKHSCKGKNDCKGQGGCKAGDNGCKGKNSCKGKGGCATDGSNPHFV
ncbi:MAG TPA: hypothetical protein VKG65_11180 [Terriglobales bacterium]|nr:hypothetical protein [Terriglobales bacterium]